MEKINFNEDNKKEILEVNVKQFFKKSIQNK